MNRYDPISPFERYVYNRFLHLEIRIMSALDDLKNSVANLATAATGELSAVSAKIDSLLAQQGGATDADLTALKASVDAVTANLNAETAALTAPPTDGGSTSTPPADSSSGSTPTTTTSP